MADIYSTHSDSGIIVNAFGDNGAAHLTPLTRGAFILDADAALALRDALNVIIAAADHKRHLQIIADSAKPGPATFNEGWDANMARGV